MGGRVPADLHPELCNLVVKMQPANPKRHSSYCWDPAALGVRGDGRPGGERSAGTAERAGTRHRPALWERLREQMLREMKC